MFDLAQHFKSILLGRCADFFIGGSWSLWGWVHNLGAGYSGALKSIQGAGRSPRQLTLARRELQSYSEWLNT